MCVSVPPRGCTLLYIWPIQGCAAGHGMVFVLSVLNSVHCIMILGESVLNRLNKFV